MRIRKFVAADMKDALAQIKRDLGPDALIVAARPVKRGLVGNGVEVTAAVDIDDGAPAAAAPVVNPSAALSAFASMSSPQGPTTMAGLLGMGQPANLTTGTTMPLPGGPAHVNSRGLTDADLERIVGPLRSELRSLRSQIRNIEPNHHDDIAKQLSELRQGLQLLRGAAMNQGSAAVNSAGEPSLSEIARHEKIAAPSSARIIALVGPTGVGKTTTIAKLAARAALVERRSVAIITLDDYRIGGEDQMRAFADLIGVPLTVCPADKLRQTLAGLGGYERIFVDTAGRSPRDVDAIQALTSAFEGLDIEIHLTLPAGSSRAAIDGCAMRLGGMGIRRVLFTKVDEAESLEELVRAPARLGLPISYITTGQRVPEDLEDATPMRLLELATNGFAFAQEAA